MTDANLTRRQYLTYGSAITASGLLAGCAGGDGTETPADDGTGTPTGEDTDESTESGDGTATPSSYTASMAPAGEVEFDSVPEDVMVYSLIYADLAVAYGHGDAVNSLGFSAEAGGNTLDAFYERLPGVSFDHEGIEQLNSGNSGVTVDKELLYELNSDLHLADPCLMMSFDGWEEDDVDEIRENVGPWFGNTLSRRNSEPPAACPDGYEYYTLWQIADHVSDVFRAQTTYEELSAVHDDLLSTIEADLPPEEQRPTVASVIFMQDTFYPSRIDTAGFSNAHVRPLGAVDAFADAEISYQTAYDYEQMLEIDPDVILHRYGINSYYDVGSISETIADHPVGGDLTAAKNDQIYPGGHPVQGPLMNLFQLEMTAKQLYPERFGEWPGYTHGEPYPEIPEDERLFDRQRVADAVSGE